MISRVILTSSRSFKRSKLRPQLARKWSWQDLNVFPYMASGYQSAKNYWYGSDSNGSTGGGSGGGSGGKDGNSIELSTGLDPVPVFLDLSSVKKDDEEEETLAKIQNFGKVSLLVFLRFRKHILTMLGKYIKVLFEDHYEYLLLFVMFFLL